MLILIILYYFVFWLSFIFTKPEPFDVILILGYSPLLKSLFFTSLKKISKPLNSTASKT